MDAKDKSLGRWLSIIYRFGQCYLDRELKPYNLGSGQGMFLNLLLKKDGITQENLAALLQIDKGTTARAIKKLEAEGYVQKKPDPYDKRANIIMVTEKALAIKPFLEKVGEDWTHILTDDFSEEEKERAISLLKQMAFKAACHVRGENCTPF